MNKITKFLFLLVIIGGIFAFADSSVSGEYLPARQDANVVDKNISQKIEVVFYRVGGTKEFVPTVKVNDKVVGSLMPNNYAKTFVCNKNITVGVAQRGDSINITHYNAVAKDNKPVIFIKVLESPEHKFTLGQIDSDSAKSEISGFRLKSNIIDRNYQKCATSNMSALNNQNCDTSGAVEHKK